MRTRRGKGRHSGKTAALRGTERHPKPGATPDSECGSSARPDSGHVRRASRPVRGAGVLHRKDCGATSKARRAKLAGRQARGARRSNGFAAATGANIPHRAGRRRATAGKTPVGTGCTLRNDEALKARGEKSQDTGSGFRRRNAGHGSFPRRPSLPERPALFRGEGWRRLPPFRGARCLTGAAASLSPVPPFYAKGGRLPLPPLMVMRQSRRKKRPPLAPKDPT